MGSDAADLGDQPKRNSGQRFACLGYSKEINEPSDEKQFAAVSHSATPARHGGAGASHQCHYGRAEPRNPKQANGSAKYRRAGNTAGRAHQLAGAAEAEAQQVTSARFEADSKLFAETLTMSTSQLMRLSGLGTILGGTGFLFWDGLRLLLVPDTQPLAERYAHTELIPLDVLELVFVVVFLLSLAGVYIRQRQQSGRLGFIGFVLAFAGTALTFGIRWSTVFIFSPLAKTNPNFVNSYWIDPPTLTKFGIVLAYVPFAAGWFLFSIASLRARVYSRWAGVLVLVGIVLMSVIPTLAFLLLAVGWDWMGYTVLTSSSETTDSTGIIL